MVNRLEKQIEGSNLALAAVAEVLQKMDSRLSKAEEEEFELAQDEEDALEKQEIIKAVATEVFGLIKADSGNKQGMPGLDSKERKASGSSKSDKNADDSGEAVSTSTNMSDQQATIQAMQKQLNMLKAGYGFENDYPDDKKNPWESEENTESDDPGIDEGDPDAETEGNGEGDQQGISNNMRRMSRYSIENDSQAYPVLENMQKQINELTNALQGTVSMQKMVQNETEGRLRKMGFREETSLQRPMRVEYGDGLGLDGTTPITKTADSPEEMVDQMMNMSYKDLRVLQEKIQQGETDGIPQEFLG